MVMPVMNDERSRENVGVQIMGFLLSLKAFVRDEKIRYEELGERMNRDHVRGRTFCQQLSRHSAR
eukprot:4325633-Prymnesium_polylepis.2